MRKTATKIALMALVFIMIFTLAGCKIGSIDLGELLPNDNRNQLESNMMAPEIAGIDFAAPEADAVEPTMVTELPATIPAEVSLSDFSESLAFLNTYFQETYGVEVDWDNSYSRIYASEEACMNGEAPIEVRAGSVDMNESHDPLMASVFPGINVTTMDQWRDLLSQYVSDGIINQWEQEQDCIVEYSGTLYLLRGGRGYGVYELKPDSAEIISQEEGYCKLTVDCYYFEEYECTYQVELQWTDGRWIIQSYYPV